MPHWTDGPKFGHRLQVLRQQQGLTLEALAGALAHRSTPELYTDWATWIAAAEHGQIPAIEHLVVVAVALALHVPTCALLSSTPANHALTTEHESLPVPGLTGDALQAWRHATDCPD